MDKDGPKTTGKKSLGVFKESSRFVIRDSQFEEGNLI